MNKTNDLFVLDKKLKKKIDLNGKRKDLRNTYRQPHFSFEGEKMIWFGDKYSILIIDLRDLTQDRIPNLLPETAQAMHPDPILGVADFVNKKFFVLYEMEGEQIFVYNEKEKEPDMYLTTDKFPSFRTIACMDLNKDKSVGYVGGQSKGRTANLSFFGFDKNLEIYGELDLREISGAENLMSIKLSEVHEGVAYCATNAGLVVVNCAVDTGDVQILSFVAINFGGMISFDLFRALL